MSLFDIELRVELTSFTLDYRLRTDDRTVGVFGHSGAGKTTVIEHIAGWRRGAAGKVEIGGRVLLDSSAGVFAPPRHRGIGYVPQDILLFPHWTVQQNVMAGSERPEKGAPIEVDRVLEVLELGSLLDRPVRRLSGGERHRVALARALSSQPSLLLLDEPLSSLDHRLRRRILGDLVRVRDEFHVPMLLISHDPTEVQVLCDRVQRLERGKVVAEGAPGQVLGGSGGADFENVLAGTVAGIHDHTARVALASGHELIAPRAGVDKGDRVVLGLRADDVLVATEAPRGISARNVLPARVERLGEAADSVELLAVLVGEGAPTELRVRITEDAVRQLDLAVGREVTLILKTNSLEVLTSVARG
ncbi:MAG: molybdenum ABC transporter ATP-binding protein [Planctomycetota bacterium]